MRYQTIRLLCRPYINPMEAACKTNRESLRRMYGLPFDNLTTDDGHIEGKENDMQYRQRVLIDYHDDGTPIYKRVQAKSENDLNDRIVQAYIDSGRIYEFMPHEQKISRTKTLFEPFALEFRERFKVPRLKERSLQQYDLILNNKLIPVFGDRYIEDITPEDVQDFLNDHQELSISTLKNWLTVLNPILDYAVERNIISKSPAKSIEVFIPSKKKKKRRASLTMEQMSQVLQQLCQMDNGPEKLALAVILFTGVRRGELLGLRWEDIELDRKRIHVRRSIKHLHNQPLMRDTSTKTESGIRDIAFGDELASILEPMKGEGYLLGGDRPLTARRWNTIWEHIEKRVNLFGVTAHGLRHSYLSLLEMQGVDLKTLQTVAGHTDPHTTMSVYVHPQEEAVKEAGVRMDTLMHKLATQSPNMQSSSP